MRSKADETFVIVETLICPLQISHLKSVNILAKNHYILMDALFLTEIDL